MDQNGLRHRIEVLARSGRSAGAIAKILAAEGFQDGASRASVGRVLAELRGPVRSARVAHAAQRTQPAPVSQPLATKPAEPEPYVPDDEAIDAHVEAIAEFIDRRVDEAVAAELADAESLKDRWQNRAAAAGWPSCSSCGLHVPPMVVLRTFGPNERGSHVRIRHDELDDLEDAIAICRSQVKP